METFIGKVSGGWEEQGREEERFELQYQILIQTQTNTNIHKHTNKHEANNQTYRKRIKPINITS